MKKTLGEKIRNQSKRSMIIEFLIALLITDYFVCFTIFYLNHFSNSVSWVQYAVYILWDASIVFAYVFAVKKYFTDKILIQKNILSIISLVLVPALIAPILSAKYIITLFKK